MWPVSAFGGRAMTRALVLPRRGRGRPTPEADAEYRGQLERWCAAFPREQVRVLISEELLQQPAEGYARTLEFLGARPHELTAFPRIFAREYQEMSPATRERLDREFEDANRQLAELLGRELPW